MNVEFDLEETHQLTTMLIERLLDEAGLDEKDRAALRKWRGSLKPGSEDMRTLATTINEDLARTLENKRRGAVIKPDWR